MPTQIHWAYIIDGIGGARVERGSDDSITVATEQPGEYIVTFPGHAKMIGCTATTNNSVGFITAVPGDNSGLSSNQVRVATMNPDNSFGPRDFTVVALAGVAYSYLVSQTAMDHSDPAQINSVAWCVNDASGGEATLEFQGKSGTYDFLKDYEIPSNITLKFQRGAIMNVATSKTLTIKGSIEAGLYNIFTIGAGNIRLWYLSSPAPPDPPAVVFGRIREVYPQWWGAHGDDSDSGPNNTQAFTAALKAFPARLFIPAGKYRLRSQWLIDSNDFQLSPDNDGKQFNIVGAGQNRSILSPSKDYHPECGEADALVHILGHYFDPPPKGNYWSDSSLRRVSIFLRTDSFGPGWGLKVESPRINLSEMTVAFFRSGGIYSAVPSIACIFDRLNVGGGGGATVGLLCEGGNSSNTVISNVLADGHVADGGVGIKLGTGASGKDGVIGYKVSNIDITNSKVGILLKGGRGIEISGIYGELSSGQTGIKFEVDGNEVAPGSVRVLGGFWSSSNAKDIDLRGHANQIESASATVHGLLEANSQLNVPGFLGDNAVGELKAALILNAGSAPGGVMPLRKSFYLWKDWPGGNSPHIEYYLTRCGKNPGVTGPSAVLENGMSLRRGMIGRLEKGQWDYGNKDGVPAFETIWVRLSDDANPNTKIREGFLEAAYANQASARVGMLDLLTDHDGFGASVIRPLEPSASIKIENLAPACSLIDGNTPQTDPLPIIGSGNFVDVNIPVDTVNPADTVKNVRLNEHLPKGISITFFNHGSGTLVLMPGSSNETIAGAASYKIHPVVSLVELTKCGEPNEAGTDWKITKIIRRNVCGSVMIPGTHTSSPVIFAVPEPDTAYCVMALVAGGSVGVRAGAKRVFISNKTATGFTINLEASPGFGRNVIVDWVVMR